MRFKILNKGSWISTLFGISEEQEKRFNRAYICIEEDGKIYKVLSLLASKKDCSISVFFDYCKEKKAFVFRHRHKYKLGRQHIDKSKITDEFEIEFDVDKTAKLSLHQSGFVQLSGKGILSGIDSTTGTPKGVGVFSSPLNTPVSSGPTYGFVCWGLENGFELLQKREAKTQYLILKKPDFAERFIEKNKPLNSYILEFFIFPKQANKYVYEHKGDPYINHVMNNYLHKPGDLFAHPVVDLAFFEGVIAIFPAIQWTGFAEKNECGYSLGSPGGSDNRFDQTKTGYNFHLICPMDKTATLLGEENVKTLEYNSGDVSEEGRNSRIKSTGNSLWGLVVEFTRANWSIFWYNRFMVKTEAQKMWPQAAFSQLMGKVMVPLFVVLVFGITQSVRVGFSSGDYLWLLLGCVLSAVATFGYTIAGYIYGATGRKSYLAMLLAFSGFIPWVFGCYLFFYRGFWSLTELQNGFQILILVKSTFFVLLGYFIVSNFYKITELDKAFIKQAKSSGWIPD